MFERLIIIIIFLSPALLVLLLPDNTFALCSWTSTQRCFNTFPGQCKAALSPLACSLDLSVCDWHSMAPVLVTGAEMQEHDSVSRHRKSWFLGIKLLMSRNVMYAPPPHPPTHTNTHTHALAPVRQQHLKAFF